MLLLIFISLLRSPLSKLTLRDRMSALAWAVLFRQPSEHRMWPTGLAAKVTATVFYDWRFRTVLIKFSSLHRRTRWYRGLYSANSFLSTSLPPSMVFPKTYSQTNHVPFLLLSPSSVHLIPWPGAALMMGQSASGGTRNFFLSRLPLLTATDYVLLSASKM